MLLFTALLLTEIFLVIWTVLSVARVVAAALANAEVAAVLWPGVDAFAFRLLDTAATSP